MGLRILQSGNNACKGAQFITISLETACSITPILLCITQSFRQREETPKKDTSELPAADWPSSRWIDIQSSTSEGHWVEAEGEAAIELIEHLVSLKADPARIFLISPFRMVSVRLTPLTRKYKGIRAGTVHTTQGKEADIVVLVHGSDPSRDGARQWAASKPNLLNVAVSRAKRRLYVIGDLSKWGCCNYFSTCAILLESHAKSEGSEAVEREL